MFLFLLGNFHQWLNLQVDARLVGLRDNGIATKSFMDGHVSALGDVVSHAKRKWQAFCLQAEKDTRDNADYSAAKHCRMEVLLQQRLVSNCHSLWIS